MHGHAMTEPIKVVAHYIDGRLLKGTTRDFFVKRDVIHVQPLDDVTALPVRFEELKALYFVRDFEGDPRRADLRGFAQKRWPSEHGRKIAVRFKDGELLCGFTTSYSADREGFFINPADPLSNNERIYVVRASTSAVKTGPAAELMARQVLDSAA
jgi:hypothetical protein